MRLRDQLKFEFFFPERDAYREQLAAELGRLDPGWETADGRAVLCGRAGAGRPPRAAVLRRRAARRGRAAGRARDPRTPVAEPEFLAECGGVGRQMLLQGRLHGPESLSRRAVRRARCSWPPTSTWSTPAARSSPAAAGVGGRRCATSSAGVAVIDELRRRVAAGDRGGRAVSCEDPQRRPAGTWTEDQLVADVEARAAGPAGRRVLRLRRHASIDGYSLAAFARHHLRSLRGDAGGPGAAAAHRRCAASTTEEDFERFTVAGMRAWAGRTEDELVELGERLFVQGIAGSLYPEAWRLVDGAPAGRAHRRPGLVGDPLPGRAGGPGARRRARPRLPGARSWTASAPAARRAAAVAGRQGGGGPRVRR